MSSRRKGGPAPRGGRPPGERNETARQRIRDFLQGEPATLREISQGAGASEKEVLDHLEHLSRSLSGRGFELAVVPAECLACGFVFRKRSRFRKPGRCPLCRSGSIDEPLFQVRATGR